MSCDFLSSREIGLADHLALTRRQHAMSISVTHLVLATVAATLLATRADAGLCVDVDVHVAGRAPSRHLLATLEQEATAIWAPYDVDLRWQAPACAVGDASFEVLIERHLPLALAAHQVLGTTQVQLTVIDRVPIAIDYDATEKTLGALTTSELAKLLGRTHVGPQEMGRALGRIVAHEIGHVLLALPNHQRQGLMRPSFQATDMVRPLRGQYSLSPNEVARLRHRSLLIITKRSRDGAPDSEEEDLPDHDHRQTVKEEEWRRDR